MAGPAFKILVKNCQNSPTRSGSFVSQIDLSSHSNRALWCGVVFVCRLRLSLCVRFLWAKPDYIFISLGFCCCRIVPRVCVLFIILSLWILRVTQSCTILEKIQ